MKKIQQRDSFVCFKRWSRKSYSAFASMKMQVKIGVLWVGMSLINSATTTAQSVDSDSTIYRAITLDGVQVVQSKENPTRSAMLPTPIFSRKAEGAAPIQTLESALQLSPAIDVRERSGKGVQADISIRGGSFDQTQVMLNGINFTDARTGHQTHSLPVDIDAVAGIELIEGVSGVGAYAGAINIRTAPLKPTYMRLDMGGGAYGYGYGNLSGSYSKGRFNIYTMGSFRRSDGYQYNTGFENWNGYVRTTYDSENWGFFDAQLGYQKRAFGANGFYSLTNPDQFETTQTAIGSLRWVKELSQRIELNSSVSYRKNLDDYEWIKDSPIGNNLHNTDNVTAELYANYKWDKVGTTTLGADYTYNHIWSTNLGEEADDPNGDYTHVDSRNIGNYYLRHSKSWRKYEVSASGGFSTSPYGTTPIWSLSGRYRPSRAWVIEAGANQSMRLPTFTDLYYHNATRVADPNLLPEQAITYRLAGGFKEGVWSSNLEFYLRQGDNIIDWNQTQAEHDAAPAVFYSRQITELNTFGIEWRGGYSSDAERALLQGVMLSYGYIDQSQDSGAALSLYAGNYMHNKAALSVTLSPLRNTTIVLTTSFNDRAGTYMDAGGDIFDYEPYMLLDGRVAWERRGVRLYLDVTNITSTDYFDYAGLAMPPAWASAGVTLMM